MCSDLSKIHAQYQEFKDELDQKGIPYTATKTIVCSYCMASTEIDVSSSGPTRCPRCGKIYPRWKTVGYCVTVERQKLRDVLWI